MLTNRFIHGILLCVTVLAYSSSRAEDSQARLVVSNPASLKLTRSSEPAISPPAEDIRLESSSTTNASLGSNQVVDGRLIGCASARCWQPAMLILARKRGILQLYCDEKDECVLSAVRTFATAMQMQANQQRDTGAANGLRAYYSRLGIAEQLRILEQANELTSLQERMLSAARSRGLPTEADASEFDRQRLLLLDQKIQLENKDQQLRSLLGYLTKEQVDYNLAIQEALIIYPASLNCERLITTALSTREDLASIRLLRCRVSEKTASTFAKLFASALTGNSGFSLPILPLPAAGCLAFLKCCSSDDACLANTLRRELAAIENAHADYIRRNVEEKCITLRMRYERVAIAKRVVASWELRLEQLRAVEDKGEAQPQEVAMARLEKTRAQTALVERKLDARLAEVDLAEITGGLTYRCCAGAPWLLTGNE